MALTLWYYGREGPTEPTAFQPSGCISSLVRDHSFVTRLAHKCFAWFARGINLAPVSMKKRKTTTDRKDEDEAALVWFELEIKDGGHFTRLSYKLVLANMKAKQL
jgi:hypothetical protein